MRFVSLACIALALALAGCIEPEDPAEAVSTVRSWTFPPGAVMKLQRPIVFQLR